ncbi:epsin-2 isoform X2 [Glossina fuscipes]|uniref:Epsin-2 isoform X2 n=1 Tax=Glossina fuscipes TaxID=7396 RepID=A0A9C5ZEK6_9MUSC|nr:epsin-2 isoform X2 [Glossina fuscipes]
MSVCWSSPVIGHHHLHAYANSRKHKNDMQVNVAGLRRNIKNLAHNYSDAQVKVREATSNDPWGPSATIMAEIADLTYNVVAFSEIMQMIWKRLNDHGKNWRHVYKALILLEYLIKTGTEKVAVQCKENIFAIQTLREFVHFEEGKDQGTHVREKAKQLVILLKDDERLKNERIKALKAKERFAQHPSGFGSDGYIDGPTHRDMPPGWQDEPNKSVSDLELVRPQTAGEEELQLQLAMAMSREEAEQEEAKRRSDDVRLQLALSQSEQDFKQQKQQKEEPQSHLLDLLDISLGATSLSNSSLGPTGSNVTNIDLWPTGIASQLSDPWTSTVSPPIDPWLPSGSSRNISVTNTEIGALDGIAVTIAATNGVSHTWGIRTQSPSVTSGSSAEGWLQSNGLDDNTQQPIPAADNSDPWLAKCTARSPIAVTVNQSVLMDPWLTSGTTKATASPAATIKSLSLDDPWTPKPALASSLALADSWGHNDNTPIKKPSPDLDEFDIITNRNKTANLLSVEKPTNNATNNNDKLDFLPSANVPSISTSGLEANTRKPLKTPQAFLGENSALVNLDNLIKPAAPQPAGNTSAYNPFSDTIIPSKSNLFQQQQPSGPSINQLKQQPFAVNMSQDPWAPIVNSNLETTQNNNNMSWVKMETVASNPFLS